ncbi:MAG TPA: hypothetical protein VHN74_11675, partial [Candidatus Angelobacter sp.]|nr:hypothetical protein [Candidatus Angelobacter sp.]
MPVLTPELHVVSHGKPAPERIDEQALNPMLYQINTRVWLTELSRRLNRPATLDDIPDSELDRLAERGF